MRKKKKPSQGQIIYRLRAENSRLRQDNLEHEELCERQHGSIRQLSEIRKDLVEQLRSAAADLGTKEQQVRDFERSNRMMASDLSIARGKGRIALETASSMAGIITTKGVKRRQKLFVAAMRELRKE